MQGADKERVNKISGDCSVPENMFIQIQPNDIELQIRSAKEEAARNEKIAQRKAEDEAFVTRKNRKCILRCCIYGGLCLGMIGCIIAIGIDEEKRANEEGTIAQDGETEGSGRVLNYLAESIYNTGAKIAQRFIQGNLGQGQER